MAALQLAVGASLVAGSTAFLQPAAPQSRGTPSLRSGAVDHAPVQPSTSSLSTAAAVAVTAGFVALAAGRSQSSRTRRTELRVAGVVAPLTQKWDPLNLGSTDAKMDRYTAVEIKHGRVAMIATVGYIAADGWRYPGCEGFENGLGALTTIPVEGWVQIVALIGAHEVFVKPRQGGMGSWDFGLGVEMFKGAPSDVVEQYQSNERSNGRLAMIGIMGMLVQNGVTGLSPIQYFEKNGFWGPWFPNYEGSFVGLATREGRSTGLTTLRALRFDPNRQRELAVPSPSMPFLSQPPALVGWVGNKGFDPLGFSDMFPVYYLREAELKHGRLAMLATAGWIAVDLGLKFQADLYQGLNNLDAHDKLVAAGVMGPLLGAASVFELWAFYVTVQGFKNRILDREPGDFFIGKNFLPSDPAKAEEMQLKELENGRLAMIAYGGVLMGAFMTGKTFPYL